MASVLLLYVFYSLQIKNIQICNSIEKFKKNFQPLVCPVCSLKMFTLQMLAVSSKIIKTKTHTNSFQKGHHL